VVRRITMAGKARDYIALDKALVAKHVGDYS
jgi:hypothetical protein